MELWNKARSFAEETAKRSQDLSLGAHKFSEIIAQTTKGIAAQASKPLPEPSLKKDVDPNLDLHLDLESFGITDDLREFVKGITLTTFRDFPLQDDTDLSDVPAISNVRQDLTEWQEKHASLVLSTVKEISRLRYELCPRVMKDRKFWRIYFILVNNHIAPYEIKYMEDAKLKSSEQVKDHTVMEPLEVELTSYQEVQKVKKDTKTSNSSTEQDLDVFLLGDTGNSDDEAADDGYGGFDDDLDKLVESSKVNHDQVPGIVFARGPAVAVLILLESEGETYVVLTDQARVPVGRNILELPAGMLDDDKGDIVGTAVREVEEETGIELNVEDMVDLTACLDSSTGCRVFPSPGGCDEELSIFLCRRSVDKEVITQLQGKETGLREHGELIKVHVVPYKKFWRTTADCKALVAVALLEMAMKEGLLPSVAT